MNSCVSGYMTDHQFVTYLTECDACNIVVLTSNRVGMSFDRTYSLARFIGSISYITYWQNVYILLNTKLSVEIIAFRLKTTKMTKTKFEDRF